MKKGEGVKIFLLKFEELFEKNMQNIKKKHLIRVAEVTPSTHLFGVFSLRVVALRTNEEKKPRSTSDNNTKYLTEHRDQAYTTSFDTHSPDHSELLKNPYF